MGMVVSITSVDDRMRMGVVMIMAMIVTMLMSVIILRMAMAVTMTMTMVVYRGKRCGWYGWRMAMIVAMGMRMRVATLGV